MDRGFDIEGSLGMVVGGLESSGGIFLGQQYNGGVVDGFGGSTLDHDICNPLGERALEEDEMGGLALYLLCSSLTSWTKYRLPKTGGKEKLIYLG